MALKTDRMEVRVSPEQRERIERAASATGLSASAFMVGAAVDRAAVVMAEMTTTTVEAEYFDELLAALDRLEDSSQPAKVARQAHRRRRIQAE